MVHNFKVLVTRTVTVDVSINDEGPKAFDAAAIEEFKRYYFNLDTPQEHAENIALRAVCDGSPNNLEGYGIVKYQYGHSAIPENDDVATYDIVITVGEEDEETEMA